ncbi:MAG TPA: GNAT family N-acetyltransferase, partial [Geminicoccaceae bacterium]
RAIGARFGRPLLVWSPELPGPVAKLHGRRPFVTPYATGWVDLAPDEAGLRAGLHGKWRNQLRRAERAGLRVAEVAGGEALAWLLRENEAYRRRVGYQGPRPTFLAALATAAGSGRVLLALVASDGPTPVAGVLLVRHGASATYEVGFTSARGRELSATHLLLWHALLESKRRGVRWLDLGGLNTDKAPGIARFKLGLGAEVVTLAGTFVLRPDRYA